MIGALEKARQSLKNGPLVAELMQRVHCVAIALETSMDSHEDATACYELKMPVICPTQPLQQPSSWDFTRKIECLPPKTAPQQLQ